MHLPCLHFTAHTLYTKSQHTLLDREPMDIDYTSHDPQHDSEEAFHRLQLFQLDASY